MRFFTWSLLALATAGILPLEAGIPPHLGYVYPAGGERRSILTVRLGGQHLRKAKSVLVSGKGVTAEIIRYEESAVMELERSSARYYFEREKHDAAVPDSSGVLVIKDKALGRVWSEFELDKLASRMRQLEKIVYNSKRQPNAQIGETLTLSVRISANAEPGFREIRVLTPDGLSDPVLFCVGSYPEIMEGWRYRPSEIPSFPVTINGQCLPGDRDRFRFRARKGEGLVFAVQARSLNPYLADAVPGWFQAVAVVFDESGNELAFADDFLTDPDPVLFFRAPADGIYLLEIRDAIWRGREDFVYRVTAGAIPFVTGIFPSGKEAGKSVQVELTGYNLKSSRVRLPARKGEGIVELSSMPGIPFLVRPVRFEIGPGPEVLESEPNDSPDQAQSLSLPVVVNGRIAEKGDRDFYSFKAVKDERIRVGIMARRLGSAADAILRIRDGDGRVLAENDDTVDKLFGLLTHHADAMLDFRVPEDGMYFVEVAESQNGSGPHHVYRMKIRLQEPDFTLIVDPSAINVPRGGSGLMTVHLLRKGGFQGEVRILPDPMTNVFRVVPGVIPAGVDRMVCTLSVSKKAEQGVFAAGFSGEAVIAGRSVRRAAQPADNLMQAFLWTHLVGRSGTLVAVQDPLALDIRAGLREGQVFRIPSGGESVLTMRDSGGRPIGREMAMTLADPVEGITLTKMEFSKENQSVSLTFRADAVKCPPGRKGTMVISTESGYDAKKPYGVAPAVLFEIIRSE